MNLRPLWLIAVLASSAISARAAEDKADARGRQFLGLDSVSSFAETNGANPGERILTSPIIQARINFNEVIVSWNAETPENSYLVIEARALESSAITKYYKLGLWSANPAGHPRQSVSKQKDADGDVLTDVLVLHHAANRIQLRLTLGGDKDQKPTLKFLGLCMSDTTASPEPLPPDRRAWDKLIAVPERSQMIYPNGKTLCSPTTVSMILGYWAGILKRSELDHQVPEIADAIYDSQWKGTGNWPFNMAYAGSLQGMRAYVARLSDISELEAWIAAGIPIGLSVDYDRLRAKGPGPNGHLVACVGFTKDGDPIINDPGTTEHVRKVFPRQNLVYAWAASRNTVYLVYPEDRTTPEDPFGHWDSATTRRWALPGK